MRGAVKMVGVILVAGGIGYALALFDVPQMLMGGSAEASGDDVDRRADPLVGCEAIAGGIRTLLTDARYSEPVKAQLLDGLLLNYRNMECGITNRTQLLLDLVGSGATAPAGKTD